MRLGQTKPDSSNSVCLIPKEIGVQLKVSQTDLYLDAGAVQVRVEKNPVKIDFYRNKVLLFSSKGQYFKNGSSKTVFSLKPQESIYGTGFRSIPINRRGHRLQLYNAPRYGYDLDAENLNYCIPLAISSQKYMILMDNPQKGIMDIGASKKSQLSFEMIGGEISYYLIASDDYTELEDAYTELTGKQPMPPRWAFGNLQSRMSYSNENQVRDLADSMQKHDYPLDAIILDLNWFGKFNGKNPSLCSMGNLTFDKDNWKNPSQLIKELSQKGIKVILVTEPYVVKSSFNFDYVYNNGLAVTDSVGVPYLNKEFYFGEGLLLDIFKTSTKQWFWNQYKRLIDTGIAGWWGDLGEPESHPDGIYHVNGKANQVHNIYGHYWDKLLYDGYSKDYPSRRIFNLNRSGFAGSQRFGISPWTGDVSRSWEGLQAQLPSLLSMSMCALGYTHSDLGGFTPGDNDEELYLRWLQFGTFCPVFRVHGDGTIPPEPIYHSDSVQRIIRNFIKLRYRMLPYNYTLAWENSTKGTPLMRPLYSEEPQNILLSNYSDEYFWGKSFLICPVLFKNQKEKPIYLPSGHWFDYWNDSLYTGNNSFIMETSLEKIPVFVRAGSFIPTTNAIKNTEEYSSESITVHYYADSSIHHSEYTMFEDDGKTRGSIEKKQYELIQFQANRIKNGIVLILTDNGGMYVGKPSKREVTFILHNILQKPTSIQLGNEKITPVWNSSNKQLQFSIKWNLDTSIVSIYY